MDSTLHNGAPNSRHVFFYGLFMDMAALRAKGVQPTDEQIVTVPNHIVRLRAKAVLLEVQGGMAAGRSLASRTWISERSTSIRSTTAESKYPR